GSAAAGDATTAAAGTGTTAGSAPAASSASSVVETPATPDETGSPIGFGQALPLRADDSGGTTIALLGLALALLASTKVIGRHFVRS
ncbi:MAG: hypothetical protein M3011_00990, partial [Actinomycetota bacterium]|nr:hypothetical protein [Actinomycetota bacterium]